MHQPILGSVLHGRNVRFWSCGSITRLSLRRLQRSSFLNERKVQTQNTKANALHLHETISIMKEEAFYGVIGSMIFPPEETFEPQMNPTIALVCLIAAAPPILYWIRFFTQRQKRKEEAEAKEKARLDFIKKLTGRDK